MSASARPNPNTLRSDESGFAMIMALVLILILWLLTVALANLAVSEYATAAGAERSTQAFLAAEAGIERALAALRGDTEWGDNVGIDAGVTTAWTLLYQDKPLANGAEFSVWLRHPAGTDPSTNMEVRASGEARGAVRVIEYGLEDKSAVDIVLYSVTTLDTCSIPGGGSLKFHGSAYIESNLCLKGGAQAGFYNDRYVLSSQAPDYFNHLYINGDLDTSTGNPSIGTSSQPYWWMHVLGTVIGPSNKIYTVNFDNVVPGPFYPDVVDDLVKPAFDAPNPADPLTACHLPSLLPCRRGNALELAPGIPPAPDTLRLVVCRHVAGTWVKETLSSDLVLDTSTFYMPKATWAGACSTDPVATVRSGGDYMLFWDGSVDPTTAGSTNMVFPTQGSPDLHIYIPGVALVQQNIRYQGKGTIVVANQPQATAFSNLLPQAGCALDFNSVPGDADGACNGNPSDGHWIRSSVSSCLGSPGSDNPGSTYVASDLAAFLVNGSAYSELNANACAQEMDAIAIVGDRYATGTSPCGSGVCFRINKKLQWYGVLMTRNIGLGQVPDFWQMPDLRVNLPGSLQSLFQQSERILQITRWREIF